MRIYSLIFIILNNIISFKVNGKAQLKELLVIYLEIKKPIQIYVILPNLEQIS